MGRHKRSKTDTLHTQLFSHTCCNADLYLRVLPSKMCTQHLKGIFPDGACTPCWGVLSVSGISVTVRLPFSNLDTVRLLTKN